MKWSILFSLTFCVVISHAHNWRVIGGQDAHRGDAPYQVSLRTLLNHHFCGGAIITRRWVVTAAHCIGGYSVGNLLVAVGSLDIKGGMGHRVGKIIPHPDYNALYLNDDIAVVQTITNMIFNDLVQPIRVGVDSINGDVDVSLTGWGQTNNPGHTADILQILYLKTLSNKECRTFFLTHSQTPPVGENNICAFTQDGKGACMGDSGSPLATSDELVGIVSWGVPCAVGRPDVFTRVSSYRPWIVSLVAE